MATFMGRIEDGEFENKVPYPSKPVRPEWSPHLCTSAEAFLFAERLRAYETAKEQYRIDLAEYQLGDNEAYKAFKQALFEHLDIVDHPKANLLFNKAWDYGHALGLAEVYYHAQELRDFLD